MAASLVGQLGDPQRIEFAGALAYSADVLPEAAIKDIPILVAATPSALLADYLAALESRIALGYAHHGLSHAGVAASVNEAGDGDAMEKVQRAWWERAGKDMEERRLKALSVATPQAAGN